MKFLSKYLIVLILCLLIVGAVLVSGTKKEKNNEPKIGFLLPSTGWGAYWGQGSRVGVELAREDIRKEYGESPNFLIEDTKTDAKEAVTAAQKLVSIDRVDAVYSEFSGVSAAASPIVRSANKVFMFGAFPNSILRENDLSLKMYFDPYTECKRFVQLAKSRGFERNAVVLLQAPFDDDCFRGIEDGNRAYQMNTVLKETFSIETTDFKTILGKMKQAKPDVVLAIAYEDHGINLFKQKFELGISTPVFCGAKEDCLTEKVIASVPKESLKDSATFNLALRKEFVDRYRKNRLNAPDVEIQAAAGAYDGAMYLYRAVEKCSKRDTQCVLNAVIQDKEYVSRTVGNGFGEDRVFQMQSQQEEFDGERFVPIQ